MDTITVVRGQDPQPVTIPIRFHLHWAGSDQDGAIAGFYYAVVETLPVPDPISNRIPDLPGPKPRDYRFIAKTDSIFIFNVAETIPDRQHAFFIYAVDNQGKADPTPARFVFTARDRFPPLPIIDIARASGTIYILDPGSGNVTPVFRTVDITDSLIPGIGSFIPPKDTVPSNPQLYFQWHGEPTIAGSVITGYRYKLEESQFVSVDSSVHSVAYGPPGPIVAPQLKVFTLRVVDQAGGTRDANRRFIVNHSPDTWFSGPDPSQCTQCGLTGNTRFLLVSQLPGGVAGSLLSRDSIDLMPALRPQHRTADGRLTFFEVYRDTVYLRAEGDTVHMNSWVIVHNGGSDIDSPYSVRVNPLSPGLVVGPVTTPGPPNGSPRGFRNLVLLRLSPSQRISTLIQTGLYPVFDPNSNDDDPQIGGYSSMSQSGRVFYLVRAEDGDAQLDGRISDPRLLVESPTTPYEQSLRSRVLTFEVNKPPFFQTDPPFQPHPTRVDTFTTNQWHMEIYADDVDPYRQAIPVGGPPLNEAKTLRLRIRILGLNASGDSVRYSDPTLWDAGITPIVDVFIPPTINLAPGRAIVDIELCDCTNCDDAHGGRCVSLQIPVEYRPTQPAGRLYRPSGPGSGGVTSRSGHP